MNLEAFNEKLKRNVDSRLFCTLDVDPRHVRYVKFFGRHREPENRYVVWLALGDGSNKMLTVLRGDKGEFREPREADIEELHETMKFFVRLWEAATESGKAMRVREIEAVLDKRFLQTKEEKFRRMREFIRGETAPRLMHLYQQFARSRWSGSRQFSVS